MTSEETKQQQFTGAKLASDILYRSLDDARDLCQQAGFAWRILSVNGEACIVTADVRMDRIGLRVSQGKIIGAAVG